MFKNLFGKSPDYAGKIKDALEAHHFETKEVFSHGFPYHPTALAYDVLQSLVAVGNDKGTIRIFGKAGLEVCLQHKPSTPIKQLIFITNKGYLISVTGNDTVNLWTLRQRPAGVMNQLRLKEEKVTKCSYTYGSHWLYVGTDKSNIHLVRVEGLVLSAYTIDWNKVAELQGGRKNRPGAVVDILEHPLDQGKVLLGFTGGLIVLWNLASKQVERRYHHNELLTSLCWMSSGKEFAASFYGGLIGIWSVKANKGPEKLITPHDTTKGTGSTPQKKPPMIGDMFSPIEKLEWLNVEGNPLFVFTGGTPYEYLTPNITLMQGKSLSMLSCDSVIVDFIAIPSSPHISAVQKPKSLLVLCEEGLVVFDISEVGNPQYNIPFVLDLHKPAVTSVEYMNECPDNLTSSLYSVQSKQLVKDNPFKPWPFNGGRWGKGDLELLPSDMIITGHCDGSIKFWHANSVSFQPSIVINTLESFEKTPIIPQQRKQHKQQQTRKVSQDATTAITGNSNAKELTKPVPQVATGDTAVVGNTSKEKTETVVTTPSKKTEASTSSPPLSPTDVQASKKSSKTLPAKSEERSKLSHINKGKSEKVRRSHPTSPVKKTPTKADPVAVVTPEKEKTPTREATPSSDHQHHHNKTPQAIDDAKVPSSPAATPSADNTPVKPSETQQTPNENTHVVAEGKETEKPQKSPNLDDFVIIELPSPQDVVDEGVPVEVPVSEYFPVGHVILNSVDWSLTVINAGLCVMIYSFQPSRPSDAVKSITVTLESTHPPEGPASHDPHPHGHDDNTDSPTLNCGWTALPEAPSASEGAGFYLQLCCQCVVPSTTGTAGHVVITCAEYSSKLGILVIGLTCGVVIVDTVQCKSLLVEVNEFDFIAVALGNRKGWGTKKNAASFAKSTKKTGHKSKVDRHSTGTHQKAATLAAGGSPVTPTDTTDYGHSVSHSPSATGDTPGGEENKSLLCVNAVSIVELNIDKHSHTPTGTIWVGTNNGNVIMMSVHVKSSATKEQSRTLELIPGGVAHKLHHPTISMSFLSDIGDIISTPSQQYVCESSVSIAEPSNVTTNVSDDVVATGDTRMTQYAVLCSEVLCKVYTFPDNSKLTMDELVDKTKTTIVKTKTCQITGSPCLISLTFSGEILVHSLPSLRPVATIPYKPLHDLRVLRTFHVAVNGSSAVYMYSPSEVQRLSLLKHNEVDFTAILPELYMEVADPELPAHKGMLSSLFGSSHHSVVDREELFGESAGRPMRSVAETRAGPLAVGKEAKNTSNILSHAREALSERGEKLGDVVESTARMRQQADTYEEAARALREKYANRKWWQL